MNNYLQYIGNGTTMHDVPARDLSKEEADQFGVDRLLASGLYKIFEQPKPVFQSKKSKLDDEKGE